MLSIKARFTSIKKVCFVGAFFARKGYIQILLLAANYFFLFPLTLLSLKLKFGRMQYWTNYTIFLRLSPTEIKLHVRGKKVMKSP